MEPLPSYEDLVWLFEAEPVRHPAGEPWPYTSVTFRTTRAGYDIEMDIEPGYQAVRLRVHTVAGHKLIDLDLEGVLSVGIERIEDRESLRVEFPDDSPASTLWFQMKPDVTVTWSHNPGS
ncbi:hypothetical protein ABT369_42635 [Dactylosporangium sp. NPDC000244]|uniref:hypothetical protein n=1 Tax=Dactylosporangium sp. NPDC000244 TaxID=3154365 RepID=UPI003331D6A9